LQSLADSGQHSVKISCLLDTRRVTVWQVQQGPAGAFQEIRLRQVSIQPGEPVLARESGDVGTWRVSEHRPAQELRYLDAELDRVAMIGKSPCVLVQLSQRVTPCRTS
jgi:hypothetical protein